MSCYPVANKITSICADFLVELRGFEPMAIAGAAKEAVQHPPQPATQSQCATPAWCEQVPDGALRSSCCRPDTPPCGGSSSLRRTRPNERRVPNC
jgi:hypothetical protein